MDITVCIATVRGNTLQYAVDAIIRQQHTDWELVIVSQGQDASLREATSLAARSDPRVRVVHVEEYGLSRARNVAIQHACCGVIAFTDDDCEAAPDWLAVIACCFKQRPDVGLVAGNLIPPPARRFGISTCPAVNISECVYDPAASSYVAPAGFYWAGGNFAVHREVIELVGLFDEYLGAGTSYPACEDTDYALRAEESGILMWTTPRSVVYHTYGRRSGLRAFLKHQRDYAVGRGAFGAKLKMWGHRLANWPSVSVRQPRKWLLGKLVARYSRKGYESYSEQFTVDSARLSRRRAT
jgi:GT2 family glycosyltransferase